MSFLDFVKHKDMMNENVQWMNEAFKASQFGKAKGYHQCYGQRYGCDG